MLAIWRPLEAPHVRVEIEFKLDTSANPFDACIVSAPNEAQAHAALAAVRAYVAPTALFAGELCMADIVLSATFESQREN